MVMAPVMELLPSAGFTKHVMSGQRAGTRRPHATGIRRECARPTHRCRTTRFGLDHAAGTHHLQRAQVDFFVATQRAVHILLCTRKCRRVDICRLVQRIQRGRKYVHWNDEPLRLAEW